MRYRIVRIELRDEDSVLLYLKKVDRKPGFVTQADISDPAKIIEFGLQVGMDLAKRFEELMQFDAFITVSYEYYSMNELRVGDIVEVEVRPC
ncbi:hypothetical protein [Archaeoglobus neptunius]|uniref:hypothetical protein n=1 Tax=Archaeoglobus neptunius TaxID=2798580 RepID=UPI001925EB09|nr:hypothetical protein [Archaeoglobus neptunius]